MFSEWIKDHLRNTPLKKDMIKGGIITALGAVIPFGVKLYPKRWTGSPDVQIYISLYFLTIAGLATVGGFIGAFAAKATRHALAKYYFEIPSYQASFCDYGFCDELDLPPAPSWNEPLMYAPMPPIPPTHQHDQTLQWSRVRPT